MSIDRWWRRGPCGLPCRDDHPSSGGAIGVAAGRAPGRGDRCARRRPDAAGGGAHDRIAPRCRGRGLGERAVAREPGRLRLRRARPGLRGGDAPVARGGARQPPARPLAFGGVPQVGEPGADVSDRRRDPRRRAGVPHGRRSRGARAPLLRRSARAVHARDGADQGDPRPRRAGRGGRGARLRGRVRRAAGGGRGGGARAQGRRLAHQHPQRVEAARRGRRRGRRSPAAHVHWLRRALRVHGARPARPAPGPGRPHVLERGRSRRARRGRGPRAGDARQRCGLPQQPRRVGPGDLRGRVAQSAGAGLRRARRPVHR
jgi:hypothetical protein